MSDTKPVDFVIRMFGVSMARVELEQRLGFSLDRYEAARGTSLQYAQVSGPGHARDWVAAEELLVRIGPTIRELVEKQAIASAKINVALYFMDNMASVSSTIPARVAELAGKNRIDIEISAYLTNS